MGFRARPSRDAARAGGDPLHAPGDGEKGAVAKHIEGHPLAQYIERLATAHHEQCLSAVGAGDPLCTKALCHQSESLKGSPINSARPKSDTGSHNFGSAAVQGQQQPRLLR